MHLPLLACLLVAVLAGALLALVIGFFSVRLNEVYFSMLTLAFGMMVYAVVHQWRSVTNGSDGIAGRSEEHTSELQSLMRISYAVFCLKKKKQHKQQQPQT